MIICDENCESYTVNDPISLVECTDNDALLEILKYTEYNKRLTRDLQIMVAKGILINSNGDVASHDRDIAEMDEGVNFISNILTDRLSAKAVSDAMLEVDEMFKQMGRPKSLDEKR